MAENILITLSDGHKIPALGFGTFQANDKLLEEAVESALEAGYRHIDTASAYQNEAVIGKVIKRWITAGKLKRNDLFLVTKLPPSGMRPEHVSHFLQASLKNLQVDYLDLYLVHTPFAFNFKDDDLHPATSEGVMDIDFNTDHLAIWKEIETQVDEGFVKSIGLSNFNIAQITKILDSARVLPVNLQVELHAYFQQKHLVEFCKERNIVITAYAPLGSPGLHQLMSGISLPNILGNEIVNEIATKHNKTAAQVLLRHIVEKGIVCIPKSTTAKRIKENINIFDFTLDSEEIEKLNGLDEGSKGRIFDFGFFPGIKEHPEYPF